MKKLLITILMMCVAWVAFSQAIDVADLDTSKAVFSIAGPDSLYVRNIYYSGTRLSVILKYNGADGVTIIGPYFDGDKLLADSFDAGYATLEVRKPDKLVISNIIIGDDEAINGRVKYDGVYTLALDSYWFSKAPQTNREKIEALETQLARARASSGRQIAALTQIKKDNEETIAMYEAYEEEYVPIFEAMEKELAMYKELEAEYVPKYYAMEREIAIYKDATKGDAVTKLVAANKELDMYKQLEKEYVPKYYAMEEELADYRAAEKRYTPIFLAMEKELADLKASGAGMGVAIAKPTGSVKSGFSGGMSLEGTWSVSASKATQSRASVLYAKYAIPVTQNRSKTLYTYSAKTTSSGRVGYGLHIAGVNAKAKAGWGYGKSYLVWMTKDPAFFKNDNVYLQLYQSNSDSSMVQLASVSIPDAASASNKVEVLYDKSNRMITVWVNGDLRLNYEVDTALHSGDSVALRSLNGPVEFTGFSVKSN